ncbi:unnamed protein product, partial [Mesorhabditis belari]|uniref:TIL domain-containing protein n=1 Tax=Mesorhabditis belari TaxID=2138241 RepID=A0AAF3F230_9BILA
MYCLFLFSFIGVGLAIPITPMLTSDELAAHKADQKELSKTCPANAEWRECSNLCPEKHCGNIMMVSSCFSLRCGGPKCMCQEGFVRTSEANNADCVRRETCIEKNAQALRT